MGIRRRRPAQNASRATRGSDAELLAAVADGHVDALRVLHERHAPWLRARLSRRCADSDAVDAAIQDTFVALWRTAAAYEARGEDAGGWIWTIAIRRLVSLLRARSTGWIGQGDELADADTPTQSAEDLVLLGVQHGDLGAALTALSPELRAVIQATVLDGLTVKEAAALLGIPEGTVKTRAMRAKAQLRESLA
jgi:RNA polymerase sigma factor (sigma-70 family)